jgi:hypothetical protein
MLRTGRAYGAASQVNPSRGDLLAMNARKTATAVLMVGALGTFGAAGAPAQESDDGFKTAIKRLSLEARAR